ncbi:MAG TPA: hypothetical protein DCM07_20290 [Planctomycetaceae bacterium]|nr:hypothetical protein [Gimesia sp.]HAH47147.1 hypothetical protein [Planctomycetaceae bacterium]HBL43127.1 hypothetical protein [Planctomycetaceae bacterium]
MRFTVLLSLVQLIVSYQFADHCQKYISFVLQRRLKFLKYVMQNLSILKSRKFENQTAWIALTMSGDLFSGLHPFW